jgi:hypothetical protein
MRVVIVGTASERARLRAELDGAVDVVAEHDTLAEARNAGHDVDATIIAESRRTASGRMHLLDRRLRPPPTMTTMTRSSSKNR